MSKTTKDTRGTGIGSRLLNAVVHTLIRGALRLPYERRVPLAGWVVSRLLAPIAGYRRRVRDNLALVLPELPTAEVRRLERQVPDNAGRTLIEIYSGQEFIDRVKDVPLQGPGAETLEACHRDGRPAIVVTGHFGNYDVARAALIGRGYRLGALYNPMRNKFFNTHYVEAISTIGSPVFARGRKGLGELLRFLKGGGMAGFLVDLNVAKGVPLTFFGKPAKTALSAAELSLKFDAPLVPIYGIRQENGLDFKIIVEEPIPPSDPKTMTQALNDSMEALTRQHLEQWFWIHRRWKVKQDPSAKPE